MSEQGESLIAPNGSDRSPHEKSVIAAEVFELEMADQKDRYLRLAADFDNYRKRTTEEMSRRAAMQNEKLIQDILPVLDNLERGLSMGSSTSSNQLLEGLVMTLQQFKRILHENGIEAEESLGRTFDPSSHDAIGSRYDPSKPDQIYPGSRSTGIPARHRYFSARKGHRQCVSLTQNISQQPQKN